MSTYEAYILNNILVVTSEREKIGVGGYIDLVNRKIQLDRCNLRILDRAGNEVIPSIKLNQQSCSSLLHYNDRWFKEDKN